MTRKAEAKILSFSTTMRNPLRIPYFLKAMQPYEDKILNHETIMNIVMDIIGSRLYYPQNFMKENPDFKVKFDTNHNFVREELSYIMKNSVQNHKESGFDKGWESRFDTWYKLMKEFGYCYYRKNKPILISKTGHMLVEAIEGTDINEEIISNVFLNTMSKYQVGNPFKRNINKTNPFVLLLKLLEKLNMQDSSSVGIHRSEISILLCYPNNNVEKLLEYINELRKEIFKETSNRYGYTDEFIYKKCLDLLGSENEVRFKIEQITSEAVDEYIRKMRITGLISLRGNGRFLDINKNELGKIKYILSKPIPEFDDYFNDTYDAQFDFYLYMSTADENLLKRRTEAVEDIDIKIKKLKEFTIQYENIFIEEQLKVTCSSGGSTKDEILRLIDKPLRFEFLVSVLLEKNFDDIEVIPNYICDDEGIPIRFATRNKADIIASNHSAESYVEVSLIRDRTQTTNEMIPIRRHLIEYIENSKNNKKKFSIFVAPNIHPDAIEYGKYIKDRDNLDIPCYSTDDFVKKVFNSNNLIDLM